MPISPEPRGSDTLSDTTWGEGLTIFTISDIGFLPGAFALFNSAIMNKFSGKFIVFIVNGMPDWELPKHPQMEYRPYEHPHGTWHPCVLKALVLKKLEPGNYLFLDSDIVIERPLNTLYEGIQQGVVVSTQENNMWDPQDIIIMKQCNYLGIDFTLPAYPYINSGMLGLSLPRDQAFANTYANYCESILEGHETYSHPHFPFIEQDVLNLIIRKRYADKEPFISIPTRQIDIGETKGNPHYRLEPFLRPNLKHEIIKAYNFLIHGAAVGRPWLEEGKTHNNVKQWLKRKGIIPAINRLRGGITLYEKSWALFACSPQLPITIDQWINHYPNFKGYKSILWRWAYMK